VSPHARRAPVTSRWRRDRKAVREGCGASDEFEKPLVVDDAAAIRSCDHYIDGPASKATRDPQALRATVDLGANTVPISRASEQPAQSLECGRGTASVGAPIGEKLGAASQPGHAGLKRSGARRRGRGRLNVGSQRPRENGDGDHGCERGHPCVPLGRPVERHAVTGNTTRRFGAAAGGVRGLREHGRAPRAPPAVAFMLQGTMSLERSGTCSPCISPREVGPPRRSSGLPPAGGGPSCGGRLAARADAACPSGARSNPL